MKLFCILIIFIMFVGFVSADVISDDFNLTSFGTVLSSDSIVHPDYSAGDFALVYQQPGENDIISDDYYFDFTVFQRIFREVIIQEIYFSNDSGVNWYDVEEIKYNQSITHFAAICEPVEKVDYVNFTLNNVEGQNYGPSIVNWSNDSSIGRLYVVNSSIDIWDSGNWSLSVTCHGINVTDDFSIRYWELSWGIINIVMSPLSNFFAMVNEFFVVNATVECVGGECGNLTVILDPELTEDEKDRNCYLIEKENCDECAVGCQSSCPENSSGECNECQEGCEDDCYEVECPEIKEDVGEVMDDNFVDENIEYIENDTSIIISEVNVTMSEKNISFGRNITTPENNKTASEINRKVIANQTLDKKTITPETNLSNIIGSKIIEVNFGGLNAIVNLSEHVEVLERELIIVENKSRIEFMNIGEEKEFEYITPILAIELKNESGAVIYLPKSVLFDVEVIRKCENWSFENSECSDEWFDYLDENEINQNENYIWFKVDSFSAYAGGNYSNNDTAQLIIGFNDENDSKYVNDSITFYAKYFELPSLNNISNGNCTIEINSVIWNMSYNVISQRFEYNQSFNSTGQKDFLIKCNSSNFTNLSAEDFVIIHNKTQDKFVKGIIPMNSGSPFYTINQNPLNTTYLKGGDVVNIGWFVNSTGIVGSVYEFFVYAYDIFGRLVQNNSNKINVTITDAKVDQFGPIILTSFVDPIDLIYGEENVTVLMTASDDVEVDTCYVNVMYPSGTKTTLFYGECPWNGLFVTDKTMPIGYYNITFFVNDTSSKFSVKNRTVLLRKPVNVSMFVEVSSNANLTFYKTGNSTIYQTEFFNGSRIFEMVSGYFDLDIYAFSENFIIQINKMELINNSNESIFLSNSSSVSGFELVSVINTSFEFNNANVSLNYSGVSGLDQQGRGILMYVNHNWSEDNTSSAFVLISSVVDTLTKLVRADGLDDFSAFALKQGNFCGDSIKAGSEECDGNDGVPSGYTCNSQCELVADGGNGGNGGPGGGGPPPPVTNLSGDLVNESTEESCFGPWECGEWSECVNETRYRTCVRYNSCTGESESKVVKKYCTISEFIEKEIEPSYIYNFIIFFVLIFLAILFSMYDKKYFLLSLIVTILGIFILIMFVIFLVNIF